LKSKGGYYSCNPPFCWTFESQKSDFTDKGEVFKPADSTALLLFTSSGIVAKHWGKNVLK